MPCRRLAAVSSVFVVLMTAPAAAQELPLGAGQGLQIAGAFPRSEPGPLERSAKPITPENPIPRRTRLVTPPYPPEAAAVGARATVTLRVTVDHLGTVGEVRTIGVPVLGAMAPATSTDERAFTAGLLALVRAARDAVGQWRYEPPADAPIAFDVVIGFTPENDPRVIAQSSARGTAPQTSGVPEVGGPGTLGAPAKIKHVNPIYPAAAREAKVSGVVIVEARIEADGRIREAQIMRSIPELDGAALDAVKQWEFTPPLVDGVPTPVTMTMTIQFSLH